MPPQNLPQVAVNVIKTKANPIGEEKRWNATVIFLLMQ